MISKLSNILEMWAMLYEPISHNPEKGSKDKAFYKIRTINDNSEFVRNQNTAKSPCMAYSVLIDAQASANKSVNYAHAIYLLDRAKSTSLAKSARQDDDMGENIQQELDEYAQDLLAYLGELKRTGRCPISGTVFTASEMAALRGINLDKAEWASIPVKFAEWHILGIQLEQISPRTICVNKEKYNL